MQVTVKDILVTLRYWIADRYQGFEISYSEAEDKPAFINKCKDLVMNGWTLADDQETNDFFVDVMKPALVNPAQTIFQAKKFEGIDPNPMFILFARFYLFRQILEFYQRENLLFENEDTETLKEWFVSAKNQLDEKFNSTQIKLNNITISTMDELQVLMKNEEAKIALSFRYLNSFHTIAYVALAYRMFRILLEILDDYYPDILPDLNIEIYPETRLVVGLAIFVWTAYCAKKNSELLNAQTNYRIASESYSFLTFKPMTAFTNDRNIQKFVFVNDDDIAVLFGDHLELNHDMLLRLA